jgi:hypothetical protein
MAARQPNGPARTVISLLPYTLAGGVRTMLADTSFGDYIYRAGNPGVLNCWKLADGAVVYEERLARVSPCSSPIATADGRLYLASSGRSYVVKAGPKFELLATNELDDGPEYTPSQCPAGAFSSREKPICGASETLRESEWRSSAGWERRFTATRRPGYAGR